MTEKSKGVVALLLLAIIFASMGVFARFLSSYFTLFQQTYLRIFIAFGFALIFFWKDLNFTKLKQIGTKELLLITFRALTLYGAIALLSAAYFIGKYSNVSFAASLPLLPLFGYFIFKEPLTSRKIAYIATSIVGIALIAISDFSQIFSWGKAELLAILSILLFDLSWVSRKWQSNTLNNKETTTIMFFIGSLLLLIISLFVLHEPLPNIDSITLPVIGMLALAAIFNVFNLLLTNYGFEKVEVITAGNILTLETVFALLIGIFLYGEIPILREFIGGLIIIWSVWRLNKLQ